MVIVVLQTAWVCLQNWLLLKVLHGEKKKKPDHNSSAERPVLVVWSRIFYTYAEQR